LGGGSNPCRVRVTNVMSFAETLTRFKSRTTPLSCATGTFCFGGVVCVRRQEEEEEDDDEDHHHFQFGTVNTDGLTIIDWNEACYSKSQAYYIKAHLAAFGI
jgi:hypothetical protein